MVRSAHPAHLHRARTAEPGADPAEVAVLRAERRQMRAHIAELRAENAVLRAELDHARREAAHLNRLLSRRWWQR